MIFPIGDDPNPRGVAWVNYGLVLVNVAIYVLLTFPLGHVRPDPSDPALREYAEFLWSITGDSASHRSALANVSRWDLFVFEHGFRPGAPAATDFFVSMFLHGGFLHLFGNMLFLWIYGDNVEDRLGHFGYLLAYLATGAAATGTHALFAAGSAVPTVGASGAISGVLGFYFLWFPRNRVKLFVAFFPFLVDVIRVPARFVLGMYLVVDNLLPFLFSRAETGVAYGAHIGGFVGGLGLAAILGRSRLERKARRRLEGNGTTIEPDAEAASGNPVERIHDLVATGRLDAAGRLFVDVWNTPWRRQIDPGDALRIAHSYERPGWEKVALAAYQRYLADHPRGPWLDRAHLGAGLVLLGLGQPVAAYQHLVEAAETTDDDGIRRSAAEALELVRARERKRFRS